MGELSQSFDEQQLRREGLASQLAEPQMVEVTGDHADVLLEAHAIYEERNALRHDAWRAAGWKGQLVELRKKLDRLWAQWEFAGTDAKTRRSVTDEALDLINATVFYIRCVREDNPNGDWPWPK